MITEHHNFDYAGGSPNFNLAIGDRYYAQDVSRDFFYALDKSGFAIKDLIKNRGVVVGKIDIRQKASTDLMSIPSITFYGNKTILVPDDYSSIPPSLKSEKVQFLRGQARFFEVNVAATATLDGTTVNFVKIAYKDVDGQTRQRAKSAGTYPYEQIPSALLTIDPIAPTDDEILLSTLIGAGGGAPWTLLKNKDLGEIDLPSYVANVGLGDYRREASDHQADKEIIKKQISFGTKFDDLDHNRFFNHPLQQVEIGVEHPELILTGGGWAIQLDSLANHGARAVTTTTGSIAEFSFFGVHVSVNYEGDSNFATRNTDIEIKPKGGVFKKINLISNLDNNSGSVGLRRGVIAKDLPLGHYTVKITTRTTDELSISSFSYGTYGVQNPTTNYFLNGQWVRSVNNGTDTITSDREHNLVNDDQIHFLFANAAGGIVSVTPGTIYFVIVVSPTTFQISVSSGGPVLPIGVLTNSVYWFGDVCANRITSVDDILCGETFQGNVGSGVDGNGGTTHVDGITPWNVVALQQNAENGFSEYKFIGSEVWVILAVNQNSNIDITFTIDGSSSNIKLSQPVNFSTTQVASAYTTHILKINDGPLRHGEHTVKLVTNNFSASNHFVAVSGWMHYSPVIYNDLLPADVDFTNNKLLLTAQEYNDDELVVLSTHGIAPTGLSMDIEVFVVNSTADDFQLSLTKGGAAIPFSDAGQGILNIIKIRSTTEQSYILGEDTDLFPAKDTRITYTGTFIGLVNNRQSWRSQRNTTIIQNSKSAITTPTADVKAIYHVHFHQGTTTEFKVTLAGGNEKWFTNRLPLSTSAITGIRCLYDKVIDGDLSNKLVEVQMMVNPNIAHSMEGFIVEIGDPTNNESLWAMQKWAAIGEDLSEMQSITNIHRFEVYGSKTDKRAGIVHEISTPWRFADTSFFDHVPFAEFVHTMKPKAMSGGNPYDSSVGLPSVIAGTFLTTGLFSVGHTSSVGTYGKVIYTPSKVM